MDHLCRAARDGQLQTVLELVDNVVDIEHRVGNLNRTALHLAVARTGCVVSRDIVKLLLFHGAKIDTKDVNGTTLLHTAFLANADIGSETNQRLQDPDIEMVTLLLDHGADINAKNYQGQTALHVAIITGNETAATWIMECGADVESRDNDGLTPLHYVSHSISSNHFITCSKEVGIKLLRRGANVNAKTNDGRTVRDMAQALSALHPSMRYGNTWVAWLDTMITLRAKYNANRHMAFCMAEQPRLGEISHINAISADIQKMICRFAADIHYKP
jgi:hypothetical protein